MSRTDGSYALHISAALARERRPTRDGLVHALDHLQRACAIDAVACGQLGRRVQSLRLARDWRRATLAERAGVGLSTVQRFENTGHITVDNLLKIASALGGLAE